VRFASFMSSLTFLSGARSYMISSAWIPGAWVYGIFYPGV